MQNTCRKSEALTFLAKTGGFHATSKETHVNFLLCKKGPQLDFVHLISVTDGVNQALKKSWRDFDHLVFLVDH